MRDPGKSQKGFSLIEVLVALAIALLVLTALLSLEMKASRLAAETSVGIDTLPVAIEQIEEVAQREPTGRSEIVKGDYTVVTDIREVLTGVNMVRIKVEVFYNEKPYADLSLYKFKQ